MCTKAFTCTRICHINPKVEKRQQLELERRIWATPLIVDQKRRVGSRLIYCSFDIRGHRKNDGLWELSIINASHNHKASIDTSDHPSCHRFFEFEALRIKEMTQAGIAPCQILSSLRENNYDLLLELFIIWRLKFLAGRSMTQALVDELGECRLTNNIKHDHYGHVTHLFFAHRTSIALSRNF